MIYVLGNKKIFLNPFKLIGKGTEGKVYKYKDSAIKIYNKESIRMGYINHEECDRIFSTMKTKFVIIPEDLIYGINQKYCGHKMKYIDLSSEKSILDATKEDLSENIHELLENDIPLISNNDFVMNDLDFNIRYNGKLYIIDSSSYIHVDKSNEVFYNQTEKILSNNIAYTKRALYNFVVKNSNEKITSIEEVNRTNFLFSNLENFDNLLKKGETIKEYILRK